MLRTKPTVVVTVNGQPLRHIIRHSPTGLNWGYGGSGPADLALSILTHYLGNSEVVDRLYQSFKWDIIANLKDRWVLTGAEIAAWLREQGLGAPVRDVVYEGRRVPYDATNWRERP